MVTRDELAKHLTTVPFRPFRVVLRNGETVELTRRFQGCVNNRRFFVAILEQDDRMRFLWLDELSHIDVAEQKAA